MKENMTQDKPTGALTTHKKKASSRRHPDGPTPHTGQEGRSKDYTWARDVVEDVPGVLGEVA